MNFVERSFEKQSFASISVERAASKVSSQFQATVANLSIIDRKLVDLPTALGRFEDEDVDRWSSLKDRPSEVSPSAMMPNYQDWSGGLKTKNKFTCKTLDFETASTKSPSKSKTTPVLRTDSSPANNLVKIRIEQVPQPGGGGAESMPVLQTESFLSSSSGIFAFKLDVTEEDMRNPDNLHKTITSMKEGKTHQERIDTNQDIEDLLQNNSPFMRFVDTKKKTLNLMARELMPQSFKDLKEW